MTGSVPGGSRAVDPGGALGVRSERSVWVASFAMFVAGLAAATGVLRLTGVHWTGNEGLWLLFFGLALLGLNARTTRLFARRGGTISTRLDDAVVVMLLVFVQPVATLGLLVLMAIIRGFVNRATPIKTVFNAGQILFSVSVAFGVTYALGVRSGGPVSVGSAFAAMLGGFLYAKCSVAAVTAIVSFVGRRPMLRPVLQSVRPDLGAETASLLLGGLGVLVVDRSLWTLPIVGLLAVATDRSYRAEAVQRGAREQAERLHGALGRLRSLADPSEIRASLLALAKELLGVRRAELVDRSAERIGNALRVALDEATSVEVSGRLGGGHWSEEELDLLRSLSGAAGETLRSAELIAQLRMVTDGQGEAVVALDGHGIIQFANPAARRMFGGAADDEVVGEPFDTICELRDGEQKLNIATAVAEGRRSHDDDALLHSGIADVPVAYSLSPLLVDDVAEGAVLVIRDIAERKKLEEDLAYQAYHDALTGLPNRLLFLDRIDHAVARAERADLDHGLIFFDLDRFKLVNDSYGHLAGDDLLVQVAERVAATLRPGDTFARMSGDEFAVLVEDLAGGLTQLVGIAQRIMGCFDRPFVVQGRQIYASASAGVLPLERGISRHDSLAAVDTAAYEAKATGRGGFRIYEWGSLDAARYRLDLEQELRQSLAAGQLAVRYQPIVRTVDKALVGVEALVRWGPEGRDLVPPAVFIPVAEEAGLIGQLSRFVLEAACTQARDWSRAFPDRAPLVVSVNLSAREFTRPDVVDLVRDVLTTVGLPPGQLCLEITESAIMADAPTPTSTLTSLRELGVRLAIDDFGTGYSSLSYLKRLPVDVIKIDQSFVAELNSGRVEGELVDSEIIAAVVRMANALGITVVAEGVETAAQRDRLRKLGCPRIQGFLVAPALTADELSALWGEAAAA